MHNESCRWTCRLALRRIQDKCGFTTTIKETKGHEDCDTDWHLFVSTVRLETICKQSFKQIMQTWSPVGGLWICTTVFFALYLANIVRATQADGWQKDFIGICAWLMRFQRCFSTHKKTWLHRQETCRTIKHQSHCKWPEEIAYSLSSHQNL